MYELYFRKIAFFFCLNIALVFNALSNEKTAADVFLRLESLDSLFVNEIYVDPNKAIAYNTQLCELAEKTNSAKHRVKCIYNQVSFYYLNGQYTLAREKIKEGLKLSDQLDYQKSRPDFLNMYAALLTHESAYDSALVVFQHNLENYLKNQDTIRIASTYGNIANIYYYFGDYDKVMHFNYKALEWFEKIKDSTHILSCYLNIGDAYQQQLYFEDALAYYSKANVIALSQQNNYFLGLIALSNAICYTSLHDFSKAEQEFNNALQIIGNKNIQQKADVLYNLSVLQKKQNKYDEALKSLQAAFIMYQQMNDQFYQASCMHVIGGIYSIQKESSQAMYYFQQALTLAEPLDSQDLLKEIYKSISEEYSNQNNYKMAYEYQTKYYIINDSLFNKAKFKKIQELKTKYETEKKEKENEILIAQNNYQEIQLAQSKIYLYILAIITFFTLIIGILLFKYKASIIQNEKLEVERKLLQSQMNPHFLFNALSAIQRYMYLNNPKEAGKYLSKFASFMRSILEYIRQEKISLREEIKVLENYLELQAMRFEHKFSYAFHIHSSIDQDKTMIPPMLLQPFIENSIEHGLKEKNNGQILVNINTVENSLQFEVIDNGIGLQQSKSLHAPNQHTSLGTTITKERLIKLNKKNKQFHKIIIEDYKLSNEHETGTKVKFYIPLIIYN